MVVDMPIFLLWLPHCQIDACLYVHNDVYPFIAPTFQILVALNSLFDIMCECNFQSWC
jgi:hypothetical protein